MEARLFNMVGASSGGGGGSSEIWLMKYGVINEDVESTVSGFTTALTNYMLVATGDKNNNENPTFTISGIDTSKTYTNLFVDMGDSSIYPVWERAYYFVGRITIEFYNSSSTLLGSYIFLTGSNTNGNPLSFTNRSINIDVSSYQMLSHIVIKGYTYNQSSKTPTLRLRNIILT